MKVRPLPSSKKLLGNRIILRLDLNVPFSGNKVSDEYKILSALPTINILRSSPLIIISHRGDPKIKGSKYTELKSYSLLPVVARLKKHLGGRIFLAKGSWTELKARAEKLLPGEIMVLENLRFWPGEVQNKQSFARQLALLGDIYVNDAFAVSHRSHASVSAITKFLPSYAGPSLEKEIRYLSKKINHTSVDLILGGAKISSKLPLIKKLLPKASKILLGGGLANTVLRSRGYYIGDSLSEKIDRSLAKYLTSKKIMLPADVVVKSGRRIIIRDIKNIKLGEKIFDLGPDTIATYIESIKKAKVVIWNGPLGLFENENFQQGTKKVISAIAAATKNGSYSLAGGGETVEAIRKFNATKAFTWISTGGGASLHFLSGESMPGVEPLLIE